MLNALIDSCHSGTILNLPYNAVISQVGSFERWKNEYAEGKVHIVVRQLIRFIIGFKP